MMWTYDNNLGTVNVYNSSFFLLLSRSLLFFYILFSMPDEQQTKATVKIYYFFISTFLVSFFSRISCFFLCSPHHARTHVEIYL
jgi:hypothetical protein